MRLLHTSDWHLSERRQLAGALRLDENGHNRALTSTVRCIRHVVDTALEAGPVDLFVATGDLLDTDTPTQLEERYAVELVDYMGARAPLVIISGNHDVPNAGAGATALEALKLRPGVYVFEAPGVLYLGRRGGRLVEVEPARAELAIACLPYPRRAELVALVAHGSREERHAAASRALQGLVHGLRVEAESKAPQAARIALFHGTIKGVSVGHQPRSIMGDIELHPADFAGFQYAGAGHIHRVQELAENLYYAGPPDRVDFDEEHDVKGGLVVELDPGAPCRVGFIEAPARAYVTAAVEHLVSPAELWAPEVVYRVKAEVTAADAPAIRKRIAELAAAGVWITPALQVLTDQRTRDAAATTEEASGDLLERWLDRNPQHLEAIATTYEADAGALREYLVGFHQHLAGA